MRREWEIRQAAQVIETVGQINSTGLSSSRNDSPNKLLAGSESPCRERFQLLRFRAFDIAQVAGELDD
jgi:hypothetical protein